MELVELLENLKKIDGWIKHELKQIDTEAKMAELGLYTKETVNRKLESHKRILQNLTRLKTSLEERLNDYKLVEEN